MKGYLIRFLFGGLITVATGLVGKYAGPAIGGLFLAFPAILPASLTLVKKRDGRAQAVDDAKGARLGSVALLAFAAVVIGSAAALPPWLVLTLATLAWIAASVGLWFVVYGRRR